MDCRLDKDLIQEYLDGCLGQLEIMLLEKHLKSCEECKKEYDYLTELFCEFDSLNGNVDIPEGLVILRNQVLNGLDGLDAGGSFGIRDFIDIQRAAFKGANTFAKFIPGMAQGAQYIKKGIRKTPNALYKTLNYAFKGGMKLMTARVKP